MLYWNSLSLSSKAHLCIYLKELTSFGLHLHLNLLNLSTHSILFVCVIRDHIRGYFLATIPKYIFKQVNSCKIFISWWDNVRRCVQNLKTIQHVSSNIELMLRTCSLCSENMNMNLFSRHLRVLRFDRRYYLIFTKTWTKKEHSNLFDERLMCHIKQNNKLV